MKIICCKCNQEFEADNNRYGGYSSIINCPKCNTLNSIGHLMV